MFEGVKAIQTNFEHYILFVGGKRILLLLLFLFLLLLLILLLLLLILFLLLLLFLLPLLLLFLLLLLLFLLLLRRPIRDFGGGVEDKASHNLVFDVPGTSLTSREPSGDFREPQGLTSGERTRVEEETTRRSTE